MVWQEATVTTKSGDRRSELFGRVKRGIGLVERCIDDDGLVFWGVIHVNTQCVLGYLFCTAPRATALANEIVDWQDWTAVTNPGDLTATTLAANFRRHHVFLRKLPDELATVIVRSQVPDSTKDQPNDSAA